MSREVIKDIRGRCRMAMNGIVSAKMREQGLVYKLNFGCSLSQIKEIARRYNPDADLAKDLWKEDVRELKILATMLYPLDKYTKDIAEEWMRDIPNQEIREQLCMNLLQNLDYAHDLSIEWITSKEDSIRCTGYWLLARLLITGKVTDISFDVAPHVFIDLLSDNVSLRSASILLLKYIGRLSENVAMAILEKIEPFQTSSDPVEREIFDNLDFEFKYYFNK